MSLNSVKADNPQIYFTFDGSTLTDIGTRGESASTINDPVYVNAVNDKGMLFNGTNQYITVSSTYDFASATTFTFECWFKTTSGTGTPTFIRRDGSGRAYLLRLNAGKVEFYCNTPGAVSPLTYNDGKWHHAVGVKNGGTATLYVDGAQVATASAVTGATGATPIYVGSGSSTGEFMVGTLDEVVIYGAALSAARVLAHYNEGIAGLTTPVTVTPPAMTASAAAMTPVVTAIKANYSAAVPAATGTGLSPVPIVKTSAVIPVTAATASASAVAPTLRIVTSVSNDGMEHSSGASASNTSASKTSPVILHFPPVAIPAGYYVENAVLDIVGTSDGITALFGVAANYNGSTNNIPAPVDSGGNLFTGGNANYYASQTFALANTNYHSLPSVNVTALANSADYQQYHNIAVFTNDPSGAGIGMHVTQTTATLTLTVAPKPTMSPTLTVPAMLASAAAPAAVTHGDATVVVVAGTASGSMAAPVVTFSRNVSANVSHMVATVFTPNVNVTTPDVTARVTAMGVSALMPNPTQFIAVDKVITVGPMAAGTEAEDAIFHNQTDRNVLVFNPMAASGKMVGMYNSSLDRYLAIVPRTTDQDDVWLKMEDSVGTVAKDSAISADANDTSYITNGTYVGGPTFDVADGPEGRPAMHFDGVDDYVTISQSTNGTSISPNTYKYVYSQMDATIEFSIRTTQKNGVIFTGGAAGIVVGDQSQNMAGTNGSIGEARLVNGELQLWTGTGFNYTYKTGTNVADGNWHHVVISLPTNSNIWANISEWNFGGRPPFFIQIDGRVTWQRFESPINARGMLPQSVMAGVKNGIAYGHIKGDMRDFIVRLNYGVSPQTAMNLYYEWSNTVLINPTPMAANVITPDPQAHGNVKRLVALYGLPLFLDSGFRQGYTRDGFFNYYSTFAGFAIRNDAQLVIGAGPGGAFGVGDVYSNPVQMVYLHPKPFMLEGYMVYPVAIMKEAGSNGGPFSADGMENGANIDPYDGLYVDNETGLPRFVDLDEDLNEPITNFDALTVVNYPAARPEDAIDGAAPTDQLREPRQHSMFLTTSQWTHARDMLRDSIMKASYRGVNLWIAEPEMALHCGFIQEYNKHETGAFVEFFGPGSIEATGYTNYRAKQLDDQHSATGISDSPIGVGIGQYKFTWQANAKRRIVNLEADLTDLPGFEWGDRISYVSDDNFRPHARTVAYDVIDRTSGLHVGDLLGMSMWEMPISESTNLGLPANTWATGAPRKWIVSAKPNGIAGKPISKEMESFYGPYGVVRQNPYKENVYTIVADRGTVVRGQAIRGRAFIELMDPETSAQYILVDADKNINNGNPGPAQSTWDYDERRRRQISTLSVIPTSITRTQTNGDKVKVFFNVEQRYIEFGINDIEFKPFISMNARGLHWLKAVDDLAPGDVKVYIPAMQVSAEMPNPTQTKQRNIEVQTTPAEAYAELRQPRNFQGNDFIEHILPARATATMNGIGNTIKVGPATADATMPAVNVIASGDKISVYMDADRNVTLFMKED